MYCTITTYLSMFISFLPIRTYIHVVLMPISYVWHDSIYRDNYVTTKQQRTCSALSSIIVTTQVGTTSYVFYGSLATKIEFFHSDSYNTQFDPLKSTKSILFVSIFTGKIISTIVWTYPIWCSAKNTRQPFVHVTS